MNVFSAGLGTRDSGLGKPALPQAASVGVYPVINTGRVRSFVARVPSPESRVPTGAAA
jgi:hypothetical protein